MSPVAQVRRMDQRFWSTNQSTPGINTPHPYQSRFHTSISLPVPYHLLKGGCSLSPRLRGNQSLVNTFVRPVINVCTSQPPTTGDHGNSPWISSPRWVSNPRSVLTRHGLFQKARAGAPLYQILFQKEKKHCSVKRLSAVSTSASLRTTAGGRTVVLRKRRVGLEPTTLGLEVPCSVQLSYRRY